MKEDYRICLECDYRYTGGLICQNCKEPSGEPLEGDSWFWELVNGAEIHGQNVSVKR